MGLTAYADVEAVVVAILTLDLKLGQIVFTQKLGQRLDKAYIIVVIFVAHVFLGHCLLRFAAHLWSQSRTDVSALIREQYLGEKHCVHAKSRLVEQDSCAVGDGMAA